MNTGLTDTDIRSLAADPVNSGIIYAGTENGRIFKSTDGGEAWTAIGNVFTNKRISFIGIKPASPDTIYAVGTGDGVFRSTDAGNTWALVNAEGRTLTIAPAHPDILYAASLNRDLFKSIDAGATWNVVNEDAIELGIIAVDPVNSDVIYIGTDAGHVLRSTDGGVHWTSISSTNLGSWVFLAIDPVSPATLYAGTYLDHANPNAKGGVFKSTNSGEDWTYTGPCPVDVSVLTFASGASPALYAGTYGGVFRYSHISPEMNLKQGDTDIPNDGAYDFGNTGIGGDKVVNFTIRNTGTEALTLGGTPAKVTLSGPDASDFAADEASLASSVSPSASASFAITFTPSSEGLKSATVTIPNDDPDESPYTFDIRGNGFVRAVMTGNPSGTVNADSVTITVSGTDIVAYKYKSDSGTWSDETPVSTPLSLTGLSDGTHTLCVIGKTSSGNWQPEAEATQATWTVLILPVVTTASVTEITSDSARCGGSVAYTAGDSVSVRGVCWATSSGPDISGSPHTEDGTALGDFVSVMSSLEPETTYYVRAYAQITSDGLTRTAYGQELTFTTPGAGSIPGDANDDGTVNLKDALLVLKILSGTDTGDAVINTDADVNSDGTLGIPEVVYIMRIISEKSSG